jgi:hypothetical protein
MIGHMLREFVDKVIDRKCITEDDMNILRHQCINDEIFNRETVDVLVALDRIVVNRCEAWREYLVATVVDFAVWTSRPTGIIDKETANWLVTTLSAGEGPTDNAMTIAFEVVREAERCDELLVSFAMRRGAGVSGSRKRVEPAFRMN